MIKQLDVTAIELDEHGRIVVIDNPVLLDMVSAGLTDSTELTINLYCNTKC
jgi:hypothetical protein